MELPLLSSNVAQKLRVEEEKKEDIDWELVSQKRGSVKASKAVTLHREAFSKSQAKLNRCEADLKRLTEERDALKLLYVKNEGEEDSLARAKKIEKLETRLAAELAKAASEAERVKADMEAVVAVYRADAEAAHARAKEISDVAQIETHEEIHARGFDLTTDIENAKVLEAEAKVLLSDNDDSGSASESESGEDEDGTCGED
ncbi:uncharacterized protein [Nicotiana sylvestris]|uniref:uncharacterized protein n=1 Tax=Nicotiana sylvestris TaxID=4096 RepID=UPI00388C94C8